MTPLDILTKPSTNIKNVIIVMAQTPQCTYVPML